MTHLIMCECKAKTGWNNKQLISKAIRLRNIFGDNGKKYHNVVIPYFLIPRQSKHLI